MTVPSDPEREDQDIDAVEAMLDTAARTPVDLPPGLMTRVLADAEAVGQVARRSPAPQVLPFLSQLGAALGGWRGMGGLVAATCAGFWIGIAVPLGLNGFGTTDPDSFELSQAYGADGISAFGWDMEER